MNLLVTMQFELSKIGQLPPTPGYGWDNGSDASLDGLGDGSDARLDDRPLHCWLSSWMHEPIWDNVNFCRQNLRCAVDMA